MMHVSYWDTNRIFVEIIYFGSCMKDSETILIFENLVLHIEIFTKSRGSCMKSEEIGLDVH